MCVGCSMLRVCVCVCVCVRAGDWSEQTITSRKCVIPVVCV